MPAVVRADEKRLRQILINLLGNAVRYTEQGRCPARSYLRQTATFEILDTGIGMTGRSSACSSPSSAATCAPGQRPRLGPDHPRMLTALMGASCRSQRTGQGHALSVRLFLAEVLRW